MVTLRIPSIDGIRAISFLLVFVAHAGLERSVPGGFGVTMFFFLSGYLITTLMRVEHEKNGRVSLKHFWLRRVFRILPPFYLVLIVAVIASLVFDPPGTLKWPAVAAQALHYTNYWLISHGFQGQPAGTGVYWSLAVEEHFYLLFPFLFVAMRKLVLNGRSQARVLWTLCAAVLIWRVYLVYWLNVPVDRTYMATDTRVDSILFGCALAVWNNPVLDPTSQKDRFWKYIVLPVSLLILAVSFIYRDDHFRETFRYSIQGIGLTGIFIVSVRYANWGVFKLLGSRILKFIGTLSYSLYLVHLAIIFCVARVLDTFHPLLQAFVSLSASVFSAWIIYLFVEKPCARLRRQLSD